MSEQMQKFIQEHCSNCKNKESNLCEIRLSINDRLMCIHEETKNKS